VIYGVRGIEPWIGPPEAQELGATLPDARLQLRRLRIAPAVGCKAMLCRSARTLRHHHQSVGCTGCHAGIICAEARELAEAMAREQSVELVSLPATHHEVVLAHTFLAAREQFVPLGDQQLPVLMIERSERTDEVAALMGEEGFAPFVYDQASGRLLPFQDQSTVNLFFLPGSR